MRRALVLPLFLAACASRPVPPPEREIFGLEVASVAGGATDVPFRPDAPASGDENERPGAAPAAAAVAGHSDLAYQTSVRIARPDGTTLAAPRLTAFAGQRATIQILNQTAYVRDFDVECDDDAVIVDPVIGMLHEGSSIDLVALPVPGRATDAALGVRVVTSAARRPIGVRTFEILSGVAPVSIQTPRVETVQAAVARRVRLGEESEWARLPDPAGGAEFIVLGRVDAVRIDFVDETAWEHEAPSALELPSGAPVHTAGAPAPRDPFAPGATDLRPLADAAAAGAPQGTVRVTAVRLPPGSADARAAGAERLGSWTLHTVPAPGAGVSDLVRAAFLSDWDFGWSATSMSMDGPPDPVVATATCGVSATIERDGALRLGWTTISGWDEFSTTLAHGPPVAIDLPLGTTAERAGRLESTVHPMFALPGGGSAVLVVEWEPDAGR